MKLRRALDGCDRRRKNGDEGIDDDPIQNDWNGSAKVALISLERSGLAWRIIASASSDKAARILAEAAAHFRRSVLQEFPDALSFVRPGFDEPWTQQQP